MNAAIEIMRSRVSTNTGKASSADPFLLAAIDKESKGGCLWLAGS